MNYKTKIDKYASELKQAKEFHLEEITVLKKEQQDQSASLLFYKQKIDKLEN